MILAALLLATALPAETMRIYGFQHSCADWTKTRGSGKNSWQGDGGYILGFVSGYNAYGPGDHDVGSGYNGSGMLGWIDQYCASNPLDSVTTAGLKLVVELRSRKTP